MVVVVVLVVVVCGERGERAGGQKDTEPGVVRGI
jgi:hypothetical protein